ncbi:MAG: hypothetical protein ACKOW3_05910 [Hyphomicrobium sp.]
MTMVRGLSLLLLLMGVVITPAISLADDTEGLRTTIKIGEVTFTCRDFRGQMVHSINMNDLGDVAHARIVNRMQIITLNHERLAALPEKLQIFFFNHECAHHVMGHIFFPSPTSENEADCWSIKFGRREGLFSRDDIVAFAPYLATSRGSAYGHLPGPVRSARLVACFDDPSEDNLTDPIGFTPETAAQIAEGVR